MRHGKSKIIVSVLGCGLLFAILSMQTIAANSISYDELMNGNEKIVADDLNDDGILSADDLVCLKTAILAESIQSEYDITGNGSIDICDVVRLKKIVSTEGLLGNAESADTNTLGELY